MKLNINETNINYVQYGKGKDILLLHGWGQNIEMMKPLGDLFSDHYRITIIDFPGFGLSDEPNFSWDVGDYALMLKELIKELKIKKPIIMGHSFGGRVAIRYAADNPVKKLVLFGSPCVRSDKKIPLNVRVLKSMKKLPGMNNIAEHMKKHIGSRDYKAASKTMREVLVNTVNEDLSEYAKKIKVPSLLIWGENDLEAPVEDAKKLENLLDDVGLIVLPHAGHYAYLDHLHQVNNILHEFLKEE